MSYVGSSRKNEKKSPLASTKLSLKNSSKKRKKPRFYRGQTVDKVPKGALFFCKKKMKKEVKYGIIKI